MRTTAKRSAIALVVSAMAVIAAVGAVNALRRPVMPAITVNITGSSQVTKLMLFYWENGADPLSGNDLPGGWRISSCTIADGACRSQPARKELHVAQVSRQSLQVRSFDGQKNPLVGGVSWTGQAYPSEVTVTCDLASRGPVATCRFVAQSDRSR